MASRTQIQRGPGFVVSEPSCWRCSLNLDMAMEFLYHDVQRRGQNVQSLTMQGEDFAVDHHIDRRIQVEIDAPHFPYFGQRMLNVSSVVKLWKILNQADASDRPPSDEF